MSASPARKVALSVVTRVRDRASYAHETLDAELKRSKLSPRDTAFATRLAYGTVSCRGTLDEAIASHVPDPSRIDPAVGDALAVAAYEILFARTPSRAAVNEGVELVRSIQPRAAGFANAVLRKVAASAETFPWGNPATDVAALARLHGHPEWIARLWVDELGFDGAAAIMAADNEPAPLFLAHLPFEMAHEGVIDELTRDGAEPSECLPAGCILAGVSSAAIRSKALERHHVVVADAGAQFAAACIHARPGMNVVELGAGRGTKSLLMAASAFLEGGEAAITAVDVHGFKLDALSAVAKSAGAKGISLLTADATDPSNPRLPAAGTADAVLVDAPCSGLGTLRRHPDRRWRATPAEIESLATLGAKLLETAAVLVKPGGFVVYSTCTIARKENAEVIEAFLASESGAAFTIHSLGADTPAEWAEFVTAEGYFQSLPSEGGPDGHFIARLVRSA